MKFIYISFVIASLFILFSLFNPSTASAHCDSVNGPVVTAARKALDSENVNYVLIWVKPEDEDKIKKAFRKASRKRKLTKDHDKSDMDFFEYLVKIHREGEGETYEGIKPDDSVEPEIALCDEALEKGNIETILNKISSPKSKEIITHLYHKLSAKSNYPINDILLGRDYILAYVNFIHTAEKALKGEDISSAHLHHH